MSFHRYFNFIMVLFFILFAKPIAAHEFWLEPEDFITSIGQEIAVHIRVGQNFSGPSYSYNEDQFYDYSQTDSTGKSPVVGRLGDRPSLSYVPENTGLLVLNHFSTSQLITYQEFGKFEDFVVSKGLDWVLDAHEERGLPNRGFSEGYTRFAKTLISVGNGTGMDAPTGMPLEIVAQSNPYTDDISDGLPIIVLWHGKGLANVQVDIFHKETHGSETTKTQVRTNDMGIAVIPIELSGIYLLDSVHMIQTSEEDRQATGAVWHSLWASLTFEIEKE